MDVIPSINSTEHNTLGWELQALLRLLSAYQPLPFGRLFDIGRHLKMWPGLLWLAGDRNRLSSAFDSSLEKGDLDVNWVLSA